MQQPTFTDTGCTSVSVDRDLERPSFGLRRPNWRWLPLIGALAFTTPGCNSDDDAASDSATQYISLWSERPPPPAGATIGVYVQVTSAPGSTLEVSSREAHVCSPTSAGSSTPDAGADSAAPEDKPLPCPFRQTFIVERGTQRFVLVLEPLAGSPAPLLLASLSDGHGKTIDAVLRRFYPLDQPDASAGPDLAPMPDGGLEETEGGSPDSAASPESDAGLTTDMAEDVSAVDAGSDK
jgi:hypothetical protein